MRATTHSILCIAMAICLAACGGGGGSSSGSGSGPTPTPQSLSITPGTALLKVNQTETFAGTMTLSNGQTQVVQPTWQSDNTTVLTFETGGVGRGRSNGTATIIGTNQGLQATRLIRVVTDYQGTWLGDYVVLRCEHSGDFRDGEFCNREDGFYVGEILQIALDLRQASDVVSGDMALGSILGTTSGRVDGNGRYAGTASLTLTVEGVPIAFAVNPLDVNAEGDRMTGGFTVTVTAAGLSGQGIIGAELRTVVRTASGVLPTAGHSPALSGLKSLLRSLRP